MHHICRCGMVHGYVTSYKVEFTMSNGMVATYEAQYNWITLYNVENIDGETVRVKAYGEDGTYSPWSDEVEVNVITKQ